MGIELKAVSLKWRNCWATIGIFGGHLLSRGSFQSINQYIPKIGCTFLDYMAKFL